MYNILDLQLHSTLALDFWAVGAHQTFFSPNWKRPNKVKYYFIISLQLDEDIYLNSFQGNSAILQYCISKILNISSKLDP